MTARLTMRWIRPWGHVADRECLCCRAPDGFGGDLAGD